MWKRLTKAKATICVTDRIDPSEGQVSPSDDGFHLETPQVGDFEWWYFDISDPGSDCTLKIVAHLGTDPLRRRFYPQLAVSIRTPTQRRELIRPYSLEDFSASVEFCDVRLSGEFRAYVESPNRGDLYHMSVNSDELRGTFAFTRKIEGCKPLGVEVEAQKGSRKGAFFWAIPLPKAKVTGEFSIGSKKYTIREGLGYHDHNYWRVDRERRLFMDDIISKWYWGRCFAEDHTIIFMDAYFRSEQVTSLVVAKADDIIHCSVNSSKVSPSEFKKDDQLETSYPARITVESIIENEPFQMVLHSKELTDKRDLLEDIDPIARWLIRSFISKPAYFGSLADAAVKLADKQIKGIALYEMMYFRNHHRPRPLKTETT